LVSSFELEPWKYINRTTCEFSILVLRSTLFVVFTSKFEELFEVLQVCFRHDSLNRRLVLSLIRGHPGRWNDKSVVLYNHLVCGLRDGQLYDDLSFSQVVS